MKQSSKNLPQEHLQTEGITLNRSLQQVPNPTVLDAQVSALETRLVESEDARKEERFIWFMVCGLLLNTIIYTVSGVAGGFASIIYLALALVLSKRWGFEGLWEALYAARELVDGKKKQGSEDD